MKRCPTCQASYPDDASFCGADGTPLASAAPVEARTAAPEALSVSERLERLHELYAMGLLTEFEYAYERRKIVVEG
ncbi:MAG TPA: SHOCT domain-containing protein [Pyrinomonadaceae bacterium]|jgi:hypothetical protein